MARGRAEDELGVGLRSEIDRLIRCLEGHQLAGGGRSRNSQPSRAKRHPANRVIGGRLVEPGFAGPESTRGCPQSAFVTERVRLVSSFPYWRFGLKVD
jgi:hypothetical protein